MALSTKIFIERARITHGDRYDYSKSVFTKGSDLITITCHEHGDFQQKPLIHTTGSHCQKCAHQNGINKRKTSLDYFISQSNKKHNEKYDYSKTVYIDSNIPITIICPKHGEFSQLPSSHLKGGICPDCSLENSRNKDSSRSEYFIELAEKIHGKFYDYSLVTNFLLLDKVKIICPTHGEFEQLAQNHLIGKGCKKCAPKKISTALSCSQETFLEKAKAKHGDLYDYSQTVYVNSMSKIKIGCPSHGLFNQQASLHLLGHGCKKCSREKQALHQTQTTSDFIEKSQKVHGNFYDYSLSVYTKHSNEVEITCPRHGLFLQKASVHMNGAGCRKCGIESKIEKSTIPHEEFISSCRKVHNNFYSYENTTYKNLSSPIEVICPLHGVFSIAALHHRNGGCCKKCMFKSSASKGEIRISNLFIDLNIPFSFQKSFSDCKNPQTNFILRFDFYLNDINVLIEYDGKQHFEPVKFFGGQKGLEDNQYRDAIKTQYCLDSNIRLIRIAYYEDILERLKEEQIIPQDYQDAECI